MVETSAISGSNAPMQARQEVTEQTHADPESEHEAFERHIVPTIPYNQRGFVITFREWHRLRERFTGFQTEESQWLSGASGCLSASVAFGAGSVSLEQVAGVSFWVLVSFYALTCVGLFGAVLCLFAYRQTRGRRENDVRVILEFMDDIESMFEEQEIREAIATLPNTRQVKEFNPSK